MEKSNEVNNLETNAPENIQPQTSLTSTQPVNGIPEQPLRSEPMPPRVNRRWLQLILIGLVIIALGVAGYFAYQNIQLRKGQSSLAQPTQTPTVSQTNPNSNEGQSEITGALGNKLISYTTDGGLVISDVMGNNKKVVFEEKDPYFSWDWNPKANEVVASNGILKNMDTGTEKKVPGGRCHNWSPDGSKIAYEGEGGLFYMNSDGTNPVKITDAGSLCGGSNSVYHWLPTSNEIVYENQGKVLLYNLSTKTIRIIYEVNFPDKRLRQVSVSPDGSRVVFMMNPNPPANQNSAENIYVINIDGSGLTQLTDLEASGEYGQPISMPIFSTDGNNIFFVSNNTISKYQGISMLDIKSKTITHLSSETANAYSPATISPDGKYVAYDAFSKVVIVNLGTKTKSIIDNAGFVLWQK